MGVLKLVGAAHRTGTSLKHEARRIVPVDALHALGRSPYAGVVLIHAQLGQDNLRELHAMVKATTLELFRQREWTIYARGKHSIDATIDLFVEQTWREYMGAPCKRCRGLGYVGRKLDMVRHRLGYCPHCEHAGFVLREVAGSEGGEYLRVPCPVCRGKQLVTIKEELKAGRLHACPLCAGVGRAPASVRTRARALHYGKSQIHDVWQERFRVVLSTLRALERDAMIVCREQLYGE
jgi:hypothetical protein